jgi:hypothetical protein
MEAIVATVIAVIAVVGLAYTFGIGRAVINRYEAARAADALASACMDSLESANVDLGVGGPRPTPPLPLVYNGATIGGASWVIALPANNVPAHNSLVQATVSVTWNLGGSTDTIRYQRLFAAP